MYVTDISGTGSDNGLYAVDLDDNTILGSVTGVTAVPHNVAASKDKIFVTHSGPTNDVVSVYSASADVPVPVFEKDLTVGLNPFGLAYVEPKCVWDAFV